MDNKIVISIDAEDSNGNVLVTAGRTSPFEEQRRYLTEALPVLIERTWAVLAKQDLTQEQRDILEEAAERLADIEADLTGEGL